MVEWLKWFDARVKRPVLLLMDNFSIHELGLRLIEEASGLQNVTVKWLPPNAISVHQPMDQGIIKNWKAFIRREFIQFMARTFDSR